MTTTSNQDKYNKEVINGFQANLGKASVYCYHPINYADLIHAMICQIRIKSPEDQIFIVVDQYNKRQEIVDRLKKDAGSSYNVKILTREYVKTNYKYEYKFIITVGINEDLDFIKFLMFNARFFLCVLTENVMDTVFISSLRNKLPNIDITVSNMQVAHDRIYSPVEEVRVSTSLKDEDREMYDKCNDYIASCISVFGDIKNIKFCKEGDVINNVSASEYRHQLAITNGWSPTLDTSIEWNKQIDDIYNPNVLLEKAMVFYNIIRERRTIAMNNNLKLDKILNICAKHEGKRILIVSKAGTFSNSIGEYITENSFHRVAQYHNEIPDAMAIDFRGKPILVKSGANKGQPKMIKTKAISTLNEKLFNDGGVNILCIKYSSPKELKISIDVIIYTTPLLDSIIDFKMRYNDVDFTTDVTTHYVVYTSDTIESVKLRDKVSTALINVSNDNDDKLIYTGEETGDIIW